MCKGIPRGSSAAVAISRSRGAWPCVDRGGRASNSERPTAKEQPASNGRMTRTLYEYNWEGVRNDCTRPRCVCMHGAHMCMCMLHMHMHMHMCMCMCMCMYQRPGYREDGGIYRAQ